MIPYRPEVVAGPQIQRRGPVQRGDEVPLEEVGAGGEGDGVRDGGFEDGGVVLEEGEGLGDGGDGGVRYCFYGLLSPTIALRQASMAAAGRVGSGAEARIGR